jgi:hypothetical protein
MQIEELGAELHKGDFVWYREDRGELDASIPYYSVPLPVQISLELCFRLSRMRNALWTQVAKEVTFPAASWDRPETLINVNMVMFLFPSTIVMRIHFN